MAYTGRLKPLLLLGICAFPPLPTWSTSDPPAVYVGLTDDSEAGRVRAFSDNLELAGEAQFDGNIQTFDVASNAVAVAFYNEVDGQQIRLFDAGLKPRSAATPLPNVSSRVQQVLEGALRVVEDYVVVAALETRGTSVPPFTETGIQLYRYGPISASTPNEVLRLAPDLGVSTLREGSRMIGTAGGTILVLRSDGILECVAVVSDAPQRHWDLSRESGLKPSSWTFVSEGSVVSSELSFVVEQAGSLHLVQVDLTGDGAARSRRLPGSLPSAASGARGVGFSTGSVYIGDGSSDHLDRILTFGRQTLAARSIDAHGAWLFAITKQGDVILGTAAERNSLSIERKTDGLSSVDLGAFQPFAIKVP